MCCSLQARSGRIVVCGWQQIASEVITNVLPCRIGFRQPLHVVSEVGNKDNVPLVVQVFFHLHMPEETGFWW
jgi:hypothetical protein